MKHRLEGIDLGAGDDAIYLRHLGAKDDDRDAKRRFLRRATAGKAAAGRRQIRLFLIKLAHFVVRVPCGSAEQRSQRSAKGETGYATEKFTPHTTARLKLSSLRCAA